MQYIHRTKSGITPIWIMLVLSGHWCVALALWLSTRQIDVWLAVLCMASEPSHWKLMIVSTSDRHSRPLLSLHC